MVIVGEAVAVRSFSFSPIFATNEEFNQYQNHSTGDSPTFSP